VSTEEVRIESGDQLMELCIHEGTTCLTDDGECLIEVKITTMDSPPPAPTDRKVIGLPYELEPEGATFDPPITLTFIYNPDEIPEGIGEEELVIAVWDKDTDQWVELTNIIVDPVTNTISGNVSHFTPFAVMAITRPAAFTYDSMSISPGIVGTGQDVYVNVLVTNTGHVSGSHEIILMGVGRVLP
jgi:hypothetical protein